jgi:hypothetical protein
MDHAVADEPVVGGGVDVTERVRAIAEITTAELGWELSFDGQIEGGDLLGHGTEVAGQVEVLARG